MPIRITPERSRYTPSSPAIPNNMIRNVVRNLYREFAIAEAAEEYRRIANMNLNRYPLSVRSLASQFAYDVIEGSHGNHAALNRALALVPRVRRIGGGNLSNRERNRQTRAATYIQSRIRGIKGRQRAQIRKAALGTRVVVGPNNSLMVAVPN
jgi:hypothetical protein